MKKAKIVKILKKYKLVDQHYSLKEVSQFKNMLHPNSKWNTFFKFILFSHYINDTLPDEGVFIEELNLKVGGTMTLEIKRSE